MWENTKVRKMELLKNILIFFSRNIIASELFLDQY